MKTVANLLSLSLLIAGIVLVHLAYNLPAATPSPYSVSMHNEVVAVDAGISIEADAMLASPAPAAPIAVAQLAAPKAAPCKGGMLCLGDRKAHRYSIDHDASLVVR
jgi:hypothetical protein